MQELTVLTERLSRINEDLARKMQARNEFDQTIQETEAAYMKVCQVTRVCHNESTAPMTRARHTSPSLWSGFMMLRWLPTAHHPSFADLGKFANLVECIEARGNQPAEEAPAVNGTRNVHVGPSRWPHHLAKRPEAWTRDND